MKLRDLTGQVFGQLTVQHLLPERRGGRTAWRCACTCGGSNDVCGHNLRKGKTISCGCHRKKVLARRETHGMSASPTYQVWRSMCQRCTNSKNAAYSRYGGRGIMVDPRWEKFENFMADMGARPEGTELDRWNNNGNYTKNNCHWATRIEQANNKSSNVIVQYDGQPMTVAQAARASGLTSNTLYLRIRYGWADIFVSRKK